jgi:hypothetical protein
MKKTTTLIIVSTLLLMTVVYGEEFRGGLLTINGEQDISQTINSQLRDGTIKASDMDMTSKGLGQDVTFKTKTADGYLEINGDRYTNMKVGSTIMTDRDGNLKEEDMTFTNGTTIQIGEKNISMEGGNRLLYKNGQIEVHGNGTVGINNQNITLNSENITIQGEGNNLTIRGDNFTLGNNTFTGLQREPAQVTQTENGYMLGNNTMAEMLNMTIFSEGGTTELLNECKGKPSSQNYVMPCKTKITMEGKDVSVSIKQGRNYGLNIQEGDNLRYYLEGGKVTLNNGQELIEVNEEVIRGEPGDVIIVNGNSVKKYYQPKNGELYVLQMIKPPTYLIEEGVQPSTYISAPQPDVDLATKFGDKLVVDDANTRETNIYSCPADETTRAATVGEMVDICKQALGINTKKVNKVIGIPN